MRTIKNLHVRHIRGARKVDIFNPRPDVVEIAGKNGSGKSSTLDAIEWGLRGKRALPEDPLHHGATHGTVTLNLGDIEVTRRITESNAGRGGTVTIRAADGSKWGQRDLEQLYGAWTFDPLAFAQMRPEQQVNKIRALAGEEFCAELARLDAEIEQLEIDRTDAGREVKRFGSIPDLPHVEPVDVGSITRRLTVGRESNDAFRAAEQQVQDATATARIHAAEVDRREAAVRDAEEALSMAMRARDQAHLRYRAKLDEVVEAKRDRDGLPPPVDLAPIEQELAQAGERNAAHTAYRAAQERRDEWRGWTRKHEQLQRDLDDRREQRSQHLRTAQLPVDGLSWDGGKIALDGTPFKGLSTTEQLLLSARIGMAMAPELRVMLIREGGLVDGEKFAALKDLAGREGYQVWMETAGTDGHDGDALVIEAGELEDAPPAVDTSADDWVE